MRRALAALGAGCLAAALSGCGGSASSGNGDEYTFAFVPGVAGDSFYITMRCGAQQAAKKLGVTLETQAAKEFSPAEQTQVLNGVLAQQPDALLIAPTDAKALAAPLQRAKANGTEIVTVDTKLADDSIPVSQVSTNNKAGGAAAAKILSELTGGNGKVMSLPFKAGASTSNARQGGFERQIKTYDSIDYLGAQYINNQPAKAASVVSSMLAKHPDLTGIFATNQFAAQGAGTGVRNAGKVGDVKIAGFDAGKAQVKQLKQGVVQALIAQKPATIGRKAVRQAYAAVTDGKVDHEIKTGTVTITQDNLKKPKIQESLYKSNC